MELCLFLYMVTMGLSGVLASLCFFPLSNHVKYFLFFHLKQESFIIKPPKKSPLALRMVVLVAVMICGVYICSMCLKQIGNHGVPRIIMIELAELPCHDPGIPPSEIPYVHYPEPTTYSR